MGKNNAQLGRKVLSCGIPIHIATIRILTDSMVLGESGQLVI